jgi:hypothetical protein
MPLSNYDDTYESTCCLAFSCIDYRFVKVKHDFLESLQVKHMYDASALPGASLAMTFEWPAATHGRSWIDASMGTIDAAKELHAIRRIVLIDHMSCGAFRLAYGDGYRDADTDGTLPVWSAEHEYALHVKHMDAARKAVRARHPSLTVDPYLIDLDGKVRPLRGTEPSLAAWRRLVPVFVPTGRHLTDGVGYGDDDRRRGHEERDLRTRRRRRNWLLYATLAAWAAAALLVLAYVATRRSSSSRSDVGNLLST